MADPKRTDLNTYLTALDKYFKSDLKLLNATAREYLSTLDTVLSKCSLEEKLIDLWGEEWEASLKNLIKKEQDVNNHIDFSLRLKPKLEETTQYIIDLKERANIISDHYDKNRFPNIHLLDVQLHNVNNVIKEKIILEEEEEEEEEKEE